MYINHSFLLVSKSPKTVRSSVTIWKYFHQFTSPPCSRKERMVRANPNRKTSGTAPGRAVWKWVAASS